MMAAMSAVLVQLIRYYLACLEKERRDDLTQHPWELSRHLVPLESDVPEDWGEAKSSPAAATVKLIVYSEPLHDGLLRLCLRTPDLRCGVPFSERKTVDRSEFIGGP